MDNLLKIGLSQELIDKLIEKYGENTVDAIEINYENTYKIINSLKILKINDIDNLLLYRFDLFTMDYNKFINKLRDKDLMVVSNSINEDFGAVEDIFFS